MHACEVWSRKKVDSGVCVCKGRVNRGIIQAWQYAGGDDDASELGDEFWDESVGVHAHGHGRVACADESGFWLCGGGLDLDLGGGGGSGLFGCFDGGAEVCVAVYEQTVRLLCLCLYARLCHAGLVEGDLSARLDLLDALHGVERGEDELPVVSDGDVALLFEFERRVERHLLAVGLAEGLCPSYLSGVSLQLEVLVALGLAELEDLCVVAHEGDALARVAGRGAEEAVLDPHGGRGWGCEGGGGGRQGRMRAAGKFFSRGRTTTGAVPD